MIPEAVRLSDVQFRWAPTEPLVLDIASFSVRQGERVFIQGPSGSGKSTLLNLLGGVASGQSGTIEVLGTALHALKRSQRDAFRADHIGFIFQLFNLLPYLGLVQNVTLPCRFSATRRARAVEQSGSLEQEARRLLGRMQLDVDALASRPVAQLSVGQQQRVAAARALIGMPEIVIADEPTSAIDADAKLAFLDLLFEEIEGSGSTLIYVSHDAGLEGQFDRVVAFAGINRTKAAA